jgi:hypothetical protein
MRSSIIALTLTFIACPILAQDKENPKKEGEKKDANKDEKDKASPAKKEPRKPGVLPVDFELKWPHVNDLEALISGLENEGLWQPNPKRAARRVGRSSWGKRIKIELDKELRFVADSNDLNKERAFYLAFYKGYEALHESIFEQARALILKWKLLPKVKDLNDKKFKWVKKYLKTYKPGKKVKMPKKPSDDDREKVAVIKELSAVLLHVMNHRGLVRGSLKRNEKAVGKELERRFAVLEKLLKRYNLKPLAYATTQGSAVSNVHLAPTIIAPIRQALDNMKTYPVQNAAGKNIKINGKTQLFICHDYGIPEVTKTLSKVTHEYFIGRYMERTNDVSKELFRIIGVRLLKQRYWFLIYGDKVIVRAERGFLKN